MQIDENDAVFEGLSILGVFDIASPWAEPSICLWELSDMSNIFGRIWNDLDIDAKYAK